MSNASSTLGSLAACTAFTLLVACATVPPTPQLVRARAAYDQAHRGAAGRLVPDRVHQAKRALDAAEREHARKPASTRETDLAYIAERKAFLALATAREKVASQNIAAAKRQEDTVLLNQRDAANDRLSGMLAVQKRATAEAERRARAALESLATVATIRTEAQEVRISLSGSVLFSSSGAELLPLAMNKLDEVAAALIEQGDSKTIVVEGHSDSQGSDEVNYRLSQRRAEVVRDYLATKGVGMDRMRAEGKGESRPIGDNKSAEGRANNRRVEIVVRDAATQQTGAR